ncbi:Os12g0222650 [Oryza sativa Japonica Group]|uniref:Os12g0222650 protein n=1 Tax=Oryza sativa subsp. japonica TaxID=39947 RepID=A0A0P0Y864_ORYSJ|nr:hypothetical protein EE612_058476 [Oryza sativa]KAF2907128.1 hypothetical protein DAI22_12g072800 [Oryza sativa Japonica Group]BAT16381.1 Os12g0222650 [Oryza sativa Japonica Group]
MRSLLDPSLAACCWMGELAAHRRREKFSWIVLCFYVALLKRRKKSNFDWYNFEFLMFQPMYMDFFGFGLKCCT